jgi:hypothetical protein
MDDVRNRPDPNRAQFLFLDYQTVCHGPFRMAGVKEAM